MHFTNWEGFLVKCLNVLGLFVLIVMLYTTGKVVAIFLLQIVR